MRALARQPVQRRRFPDRLRVQKAERVITMIVGQHDQDVPLPRDPVSTQTGKGWSRDHGARACSPRPKPECGGATREKNAATRMRVRQWLTPSASVDSLSDRPRNNLAP